jgi:hypothetical protein
MLASAADARQIGISTRLLVVDNGSPTDATRAVAERLGVEYIRMPEHLGRRTPSYGRVVGLATVDSPYQAFFDDDDVMLPRWIRLHVEALQSGFDVCSTSFWETDDDLLVSRKVVPIPTTLGDLMAGRFSINDQSLIRRSALEGITWEPDLDNVMVLPVWLELTLRGCAFHRLEEATFLRRVHGGSVTRTSTRPMPRYLRSSNGTTTGDEQFGCAGDADLRGSTKYFALRPAAYRVRHASAAPALGPPCPVGSDVQLVAADGSDRVLAKGEAVALHEALDLRLERLVAIERDRLDLHPDRPDTFEQSARSPQHEELGALHIEVDEIDGLDAEAGGEVVEPLGGDFDDL